MKRFATIRNGTVTRVFVATDAALARMVEAAEAKVADLRSSVDVTELGVGPGHFYDADKGTFTAPPEPEEVDEKPLVKQVEELRAELEALKAGK